MSNKYEIWLDGALDEPSGYGGKFRTLNEAILNAKKRARQFGGEWIVVRRRDGKIVWRPGMSYKDAIRACRTIKSI